MGMNFKAAIYETGDIGFYLVVGLLVSASLLATVFARRRGWL
jgi:Mg2+ and Co2+ transporter CorA